MQGFGGLPVARQGVRFAIHDSRFTGVRGVLQAPTDAQQHHAELVGLVEAIEGLLVLFGEEGNVLGGGREAVAGSLEA